MVINTGTVEVHEIDVTDHHVLDEVFAGLSVESRYQRYLTPMPTLPAQARRALTTVVGCCHLAVAAFVGGKAIGLARVIDIGGDRAELAIEIVDAWQGRGVGIQLATWIRDRADGLGYTELVAETSAGNSRAQALMRKVFPNLVARREGTVIVFTVPVDTIHPTAA
jgi:GNAT superfamily N-acetyltransferase